MEGDYHRQIWTTWFLWKEDVKLLEICQLFAICGEKAPARSAVFNGVRRFGSGKEMAQVAVHEW
jgi:hypothetical protein